MNIVKHQLLTLVLYEENVFVNLFTKFHFHFN